MIETILNYVRENALEVPADFGARSPIFSTGVLDSFDLIELLALIETETGHQIGTADVSLENFDTAERIHTFVLNH